MLDLVAILQLVIDGFNEVPLPEHKLIPEWEQPVLHVFLNAGNELRTLSPEYFKQLFGDVSSVGV